MYFEYYQRKKEHQTSEVESDYLVFLSPEQTEESNVSRPFLLTSGGLLAFPGPCVKHANDY